MVDGDRSGCTDGDSEEILMVTGWRDIEIVRDDAGGNEMVVKNASGDKIEMLVIMRWREVVVVKDVNGGEKREVVVVRDVSSSEMKRGVSTEGC